MTLAVCGGRARGRARAGARTGDVFLLALAAFAALPDRAGAQEATTYVTNFGHGRGSQVGSTGAEFARLAQVFRTGSAPGGYRLSSIDIINQKPQNRAISLFVCGTRTNAEVSSYVPTSSCTRLTAPRSFPSGTLAFTAPANFVLSESTRYAVVLVALARRALSATTSDNEDSPTYAGWSIDHNYLGQVDKDDWFAKAAAGSIRIAVKGVLGMPTVVPDPPTDLRATRYGDTQINLRWTAPAVTGDAPIEGYRIPVSTDGAASFSNLIVNTGNTDTAWSHAGVALGDTGHYRVRVINAAGASNPSAIAFATTCDAGIGQRSVSQGARKLSGYADVWGVRVGRYRILYGVAETALVIVVLKVGHRKDVYR